MSAVNFVGFVNVTNAHSNTGVFFGNNNSSNWSHNQKRMPGLANMMGNFNLLSGNATLLLDQDFVDTQYFTPTNRQGAILGG